MSRLDKKIIEFLAKKLEQAPATIKKNVSLLAHKYPNVTPNARAHLYAQQYRATAWGKLSKEDRQSLPNIEVQKEKVQIKQRVPKNGHKKIIPIVIYETADPFRKGHIEEINRAYAYKCYTSVFILCRKVIENMLVDVLRAKFPGGTKENKELYFDTTSARYKYFSVILKNFRNKSRDFGTERKLVERIAQLADVLKEKANDKAHSWFHLVRRPKEITDLDVQNIFDLIKNLETSLRL